MIHECDTFSLDQSRRCITKQKKKNLEDVLFANLSTFYRFDHVLTSEYPDLFKLKNQLS